MFCLLTVYFNKYEVEHENKVVKNGRTLFSTKVQGSILVFKIGAYNSVIKLLKTLAVTVSGASVVLEISVTKLLG